MKPCLLFVLGHMRKAKLAQKLQPSRFRRNEKTFDKKFARDLGIHSRAGRINFFGTTWGAFHVEKRVRKFRCEFHFSMGKSIIWQENPEISVWSQFSGNSIRKLWSTFRGTPLFPFGTERRKFPYHLLNFPVSHQPKTITGNQTANGKRHFVRLVCLFGKTLTIIQRSSQSVCSDKW